MTPFDRIAARIATTEYVILMKDRGRLTLLADLGLGKPWHSPNKRLADHHAKECDGEARPFKEAWDLLLKDNPNFERELVRRAEQFSKDLVQQEQSKVKQILDPNGRPLQ